MTLPNLSEYSEALQTPRFSLIDPELQACTVECTPLGVPRPRSGGFAITYHLHNHRHWAVRCFYRPVPDLAQRYQLITAYLQKIQSPRFVTFEYQPEGIVVHGRRLPIVKMEWVAGETLGSFLSRHYRDGAVVKCLRQDFADLVLHLEQLGVAHGDLQHGNIVVETSGSQLQLRLIDYDGMYVPGMELYFQSSNEVGHPHYQHPARTNAHFGPYLDRFSAAIIYLSLMLIERDPSLFDRYHTGENILFTNTDYVKPSASQLFSELQQRLQAHDICQRLELLLRTPPDQLPTFKDFYDALLQQQPTPQPAASASLVTPPRPRSPYPVLPASDRLELLRRVGEVVEVIGQVTGRYVGTTKYGSPYMFLNFGDWREGAFYVVLWEEVLLEFSRVGRNPEDLLGQWVSVTGLLTSFKLKSAREVSPQIQLERVHQIRVLTPAEARAHLSQSAADTLTDFPARSFGSPTNLTNRERVRQYSQQRVQPTASPPLVGSKPTTKSASGKREAPTPSYIQTNPTPRTPSMTRSSNQQRMVKPSRTHDLSEWLVHVKTVISGIGSLIFLSFLCWLLSQCSSF